MAVEQPSRPVDTADSSVFTYQPKILELSNKIALSLADDFLTRQQKHVEKQRQFVEQALPPAFRRVKLAPIAKRKSVPATNEIQTSETDQSKTSPRLDSQEQATRNNSKTLKESPTENKVSQMISSSPYAKDPVKRRHQSKPDAQRGSMSKSINAVDTLVQRRERSASPSSALRPSRSRTMPSFTGNSATAAKPLREPTACTLDRLQRAHELVERAIAEKKIFCIAGTYYALREALRERGWVEKFCFAPGGASATAAEEKSKKDQPKECKIERCRPKTRNDSSDSDDDGGDCCDADDDCDEDKNRVPPWEEENGFYGTMSRMVKNHLPNFIFTTKTSTIEYKMLQKDQIVNHYGKNSCLTTKNGLCVNLRNLPWYEPVDPNVFFPRCYKISTDEEKQEFIEDFRLSACMSVIKWILGKFEPRSQKSPSSPSEKSSPVPNNNNSENRQLSATKMPNQGSSNGGGSKDSSSSSSSSNTLPAKFLDIAVEQCEKYLTERDHGFIDVPREPNTLNDVQWDQFLGWYYQLVHNHGRLSAISYSLEKLKNLALRLEAVHPQFRMDGSKNMWIVKPGAKSRGRGVQCYARLEEIVKLVSSQLIREGKYVVQKYIERPLLIYDVKFDIRQWFVVTDWNPLTMYFYDEMYLRFCSQIFTLDKYDESVHLSNNAIQCHYSNAKDRNSKLPPENMWTCHQFKDFLAEELGQPNVYDEIIYPGMKNAIIWALEACQDVIAPRKNSFELFGADFMLTEDFQPWLIEINCSPCLAPSTAITARMCPQVQEDVLKLILDRRSDKNCSTGHFELGFRQQIVSAPNYLGLSLAVEGQNCGRRVKATAPGSFSHPLMNLVHSASASDGNSPASSVESDSDSENAGNTPRGGGGGGHRAGRNHHHHQQQQNHQHQHGGGNLEQRKSLPVPLSLTTKRPDPSIKITSQHRKNKKSEGIGDTIVEEAEEDYDSYLPADVMCYQPDDDLMANGDAETVTEESEEQHDDQQMPIYVNGVKSSLPFTSFAFSRPKEERPELPVTGHNRYNTTLRKAEQNKQTVATIMTYHPPLPTRRPRTFMSYSSFIPSRILKGPIFISNNALESILNRARNTIAAAGALMTVNAANEQAAYKVEHQSADDDPLPHQTKYYTFPKQLPKKAKVGGPRQHQRRSLTGREDVGGSLFSPVRRVALDFRMHPSSKHY